MTESTDFFYGLGRTTINNNNNIITTNNNEYINVSTPERNKPITEGYALEVAPLRGSLRSSLREPKGSGGSGDSGEFVAAPATEALKNLIQDPNIPANWDFIKIDLFDNSTVEQLQKNKRKLRISLSVKKSGQQDWMKFRSDINSPFRHMKRGLESSVWENDPHYQNVRDTYEEFKVNFKNVRASKFYEYRYKTQGQSIEGLSVVLAELDEPGHYIISLLYNDQQWLWKMRGDRGYLSDAQRKKNVIATVSIKPGQKVKNKNAKDLLG